MYLTANQTAQLQTTYRSAIAASLLVYSTAKLVNRLFLLPVVDHLWGNACDWQETLVKGRKVCKPVVLDIVLLVYLLCKLVGEKTDRYVNQCLQPLSEPVNQTQTVIDRELAELEILVNQLNEPTEYTTLETTGALPRLERVSTGLQGFEPTEAQLDTLDDMGAVVIGEPLESAVDQHFQPIEDEFTADQLATLIDMGARLPKPRKRAKAAIVETLIKRSI